MSATKQARWWHNPVIVLVIAVVVCAIALSILLQVLANYVDSH